MFTSKNFKYVVVKFPMKMKKNIQQKLSKFAQTLQILNDTFKPTVVLKFSRIKVLLALPIFLYGIEIITLIKRDKNDLHQLR